MMDTKAFYDPATFTLTYVVWNGETKDAVVIDPVLDYDPLTSQTSADRADEVTSFVRAQGLKVHYVLETHAHADHLSSSQLLKRRFEAKVGIGRRITDVQKTFKQIFDFGDDFATDGRQFDRLFDDGETFDAGALRIEVIHTPGHTPACVTYKIGDAVFTGDVLFMDDYGTGRCDFPNGSAEAMYDSLRRLYALPDETRVFVGHDYQPNGREVKWETTIGKSKTSNPQMRAETTKEAFVTMRNARDATLRPPRLIFQSVQVNVNAGCLPRPHENGVRYLVTPLNLFGPTDDLGVPLKQPQ
jgi:glyoxylase-like metal-dependent hydrolase (beta-lactamase superfamily II)